MLANLYLSVTEHIGFLEAGRRRQARRELLGMSDRLLADAGVSRNLLNQGVRAWPWRPESDTTPTFVPSASVLEFPGRHRFISETYDQGAVRQPIAA